MADRVGVAEVHGGRVAEREKTKERLFQCGRSSLSTKATSECNERERERKKAVITEYKMDICCWVTRTGVTLHPQGVEEARREGRERDRQRREEHMRIGRMRFHNKVKEGVWTCGRQQKEIILWRDA